MHFGDVEGLMLFKRAGQDLHGDSNPLAKKVVRSIKNAHDIGDVIEELKKASTTLKKSPDFVQYHDNK